LGEAAPAGISLYSPGPDADFPARVCTTLRRCLSFDFLGYHEIVDNFQNRRAVTYPEFDPDMQAFTAYLHHHRTWNGVIRERLGSSAKISDFVSRDEWHRTDLSIARKASLQSLPVSHSAL
jgi:hypothetical protein